MRRRPSLQINPRRLSQSNPLTFIVNLFQSNAKFQAINAEDQSMDGVVIAVMGPTGSGKSTFIEMATGITGIVGHSLESFTNGISVFKFSLSGLNMCFVDTPGFDDTNKSDVEIFKMISEWIIETFKRQIRLTGLLYFHRISDNRMAGTPLRNLHLFEKLCGEDFDKIILTTTMWNDVDELLGGKREEELKSTYWKSMIDRGSSVKRFLGTRESAFEILTPIFDELHRRSVLLQREMQDLRSQPGKTSAGMSMHLEIQELVSRHQGTHGRIRSGLKDSIDDSDDDEMQNKKGSKADKVYRVLTIVDWTKRFSGFSFKQNSKEDTDSDKELEEQVKQWQAKAQEMEKQKDIWEARAKELEKQARASGLWDTWTKQLEQASNMGERSPVLESESEMSGKQRPRRYLTKRRMKKIEEQGPGCPVESKSLQDPKPRGYEGAELQLEQEHEQTKEGRQDAKILLCLGPPGSGKSQFIDTLTEQTNWAGESLQQHRHPVRDVHTTNSNQTRPIILLDTPGFDGVDTDVRDVLDEVEAWLINNRRQTQLAGVLYFHKITETRLTVQPPFQHLKKLCGDSPKLICFVTTHWDCQTREPEKRNEKELELKTGEWKSLIDSGAHAARFDRSTTAAKQIVQLVLS